MRLLPYIWLCASFFAAATESARIICIHPSPSRSHVIVSKALLTELAAKGHEVTMVSAFPLEQPIPNYRDIVVSLGSVHDEIMSGILHDAVFMFSGVRRISNAMIEATSMTLNNEELQRVVQNETFDLIIFGYFITDFHFGLMNVLNCPAVVLWPGGTSRLTNMLVGNPAEVSAVPQLLLGYQNPMNFYERVINLLANVAEFALERYIHYQQINYYKYHFPADLYPSYNRVLKNISLVLVNDHFSQGSIRPYVPNMIEVGGLQVKKSPSSLPADVQAFMDAAKDGVIYFSLGSNFKSSRLEKSTLASLLRTFSKLKQRILFKWESDKLPGQPDNMMIGKWLPQDDILAHNNTRLFVTHGGLGSIVEAKYHGVPVVGIPIFGDQITNLERVELDGWGRIIKLEDLNEESFSRVIKEVLSNPSYKDIVQQLANTFKDRPMSALDTAVYWVEYVIRHQGAYHMRYQGVDLNLLQASSVDVVLFLALIIYAVFKMFQLTFKFCCRRRIPESKVKTN